MKCTEVLTCLPCNGLRLLWPLGRSAAVGVGEMTGRAALPSMWVCILGVELHC